MTAIPTDVVKAELVARIRALVAELAPGGRWAGAYYQARNPIRSGKDGGTSFTVWSNGAFKEFDSDEKGDVFGLIQYVRGCDFAEAKAWAIGWTGLGSAPADVIDRRRRQVEKAQRDADEEERLKVQRKKALAFELWLKARPITPGDLPSRYMAGRACPFEDVVGLEPSFRFHPSLADGDGGFRPALVSSLVDQYGAILGIHRTYLIDGPKGATKAPIARAKKVLGQVSGCVVRVAHGTLGPIGDGAPAGELIITEGLEDALTIAAAYPDARVWAAYSLGNMAQVPVDLPFVTRVTIAAQNDLKPEPVAMLGKAVAALEKLRPVEIVKPPSGFKDFNDFAQAQARRHPAAADGED